MNLMLQYWCKVPAIWSTQLERIQFYESYLKESHSPMTHIAMAAKASHSENHVYYVMI